MTCYCRGQKGTSDPWMCHHSSSERFHKCHSCRTPCRQGTRGLEALSGTSCSRSTTGPDTSSCLGTSLIQVHNDAPKVFLEHGPMQRRKYHTVQCWTGCPANLHTAFLAELSPGTNNHRHLTSHACNPRWLPSQIPGCHMGSGHSNHLGGSPELKSKYHSYRPCQVLLQTLWTRASKNIPPPRSTRATGTSCCR